MKIVNKIAILISWPRELDMFSAFVESIADDVILIVDDFSYYTQEEKYKNAENIIELIGGRIDYVLLSKVLGKLKYKILLSTAQTLHEKITFSSYLKYIYAISIGSFIHHSGLSKIFLKAIGRELTGGGKYETKFERRHIERLIGVKVIKYPKGLDISKLTYPEKQWEGVFDVFFCHSKIDQDLITNKFLRAKCINIGYPRYDNLPSVESSKNIIYNEISGVDISKPTLLWIPTIIRFKDGLVDNIKIWLPDICSLLGEYNIIIRPHPKILVINPEMIVKLTELGFLVDVKKNRDLGVLYQSVDLVLADYGGSVLSAIYMKKKLILLNFTSEYTNMREKRMYVDNDVRKYVNSFNTKENIALAEQVRIDIQDKNKSKINRLKIQYFGDELNHIDIKEIACQLAKEIRT
ncbi:hypothetical protein HOK00_03180 [bacterium]|jgi:hypothetical protein|nr:hypothetical protein [bacterium]